MIGDVHCSNGRSEDNEEERSCENYWKDSREQIEISLESYHSMLECGYVFPQIFELH